MYDGSDRARPCQTELDVSLCFAPLLRWVLTWWRSDTLALAVDHVETEPGFPSLELANTLAEQDGVILSSPNWAREVELK